MIEFDALAEASKALEGTEGDFLPISSFRDWVDGCSNWNQGTHLFADGSVPFVVNNNGQASKAAVQVLIANLEEHPPEQEHFSLLEIGAGSGLFAKFFLDELQKLAPAWYARCTYVITDGSPSMVDDWTRNGQFASHDRRVVARVWNALEPLETGECFRAVFANYVVDTFPATVLRRQDGACEELRLRIDDATGKPVAHYFPVENYDEFRNFLQDGERACLNYGALQMIEREVAALEHAGFFLINDYGATTREQMASMAGIHGFGPTVATGVNFVYLETYFLARGYAVATSPSDGQRGIHSRLVCKRELTETGTRFATHFSLEVDAYLSRPAEEAREHRAGLRHAMALDAFREGLQRNEYDWTLAGAAAEFLCTDLRNYEAALQMARDALALNSWYSPWLWNLAGDSLYYLQRHSEAEEHYQRALAIDHRDLQGLYNLSFIYLARQEHEAALQVLARGLAYDTKGNYREMLLAQQSAVLHSLSAVTGKRREQDELRARLFT